MKPGTENRRAAADRRRLARRRAEHVLRERSNVFGELTEQLKDVFYLLSPDFKRMLFVNRAYEAIWGCSRESLYQRPASWLEAVHPDDRPRVGAAWQVARRSPAHFDEVYRIVRPDASVRWIRDRSFAVRGESGEIQAVGGFAADITEQRRSVEALRESEARNRAILEATLDAIVQMDQGGRVTWWNTRAEAMFGWPREEAVGRTVSELLIPARYRDAHARGLTRFLATGEGPVLNRRIEMSALHRDGREFPVELMVTTVQWEGSFSFNAFIEDITARKQAEQALRQLSGELLRLQDDERRRIARDLHDSTAQALAALALNLKAASRGAGALPAAARAALSESQTLAAQCIREVRTLSYLLHPPLLDEAGLVSALGWYTDGLKARSGLRIALEVPTDLGRLGSELELAAFRIVQESLTNIHRHSGSRSASIRLAREDGVLSVEVRDRGRGMPAGVLRSVNSESVGRGLGIAGMRERVRQLGGRLEIHSGARGTSVRASLPLRGRDQAS